MVDNIIKGKTRTRREFCSFYTDSDPILDYMVKRLNIEDNDIVLEPCAGDGVFLEKILNTVKKQFQADAVDLNDKAIEKLTDNFKSYGNIRIKKADTLLDGTFDLLSNSGGFYSKIIGNPPYGAWQDFDKRKVLKKKYNDYAKETYTLFIHRALDLLKDNGRLVYIVPDTFLALNLHKNLRQRLLSTSVIEEVVIMPSKFFPGVKFGYSNLCIFSLRKTEDKEAIKKNTFKLITIKSKVENLYDILEENFNDVRVDEMNQSEVINSVDYSFLIGASKEERRIINSSKIRLGDVADCVTGFYSGNNGMFIKTKGELTTEEIYNGDFESKSLIEGLDTHKKTYIPIYKGKGFIVKEKKDYVLWNKDTVNFYKSDSKARFQNDKYYFRLGIGVPMVKSKKIEAFFIEDGLFDQSVVGIFPKDNTLTDYILGFLNSSIGNRFLQVINHTSNNSANYLKKVPLIVDLSRLNEIKAIIDSYKQSKQQDVVQRELDFVFNEIYSIAL